MYRISKIFSFDAVHCLPHLPSSHKCSRPHGHTYRVQVELATPYLDERGFVIDYGDLSPLKEWIDSTLDHRDLNQVFPDMPTTAEKLAEAIFNWCKYRWPQTERVGVSETQPTWAWYSETAVYG